MGSKGKVQAHVANPDEFSKHHAPRGIYYNFLRQGTRDSIGFPFAYMSQDQGGKVVGNNGRTSQANGRQPRSSQGRYGSPSRQSWRQRQGLVHTHKSKSRDSASAAGTPKDTTALARGSEANHVKTALVPAIFERRVFQG